MKPLLVLPLLAPLTAAAISLFFWRSRIKQRAIGLAGSLTLLGIAIALLHSVSRDGIQAVQIGNWPSPFGITLVADLLSAIMVVMAGLVGSAVTIYSTASLDVRRESYAYYPLIQILLMGVCGAFLTGDLFNLYVWFEVMLIASFVLLVLGGQRDQMEGGIKYFTLNLISSTLFLAAVGLLYGLTGTLNMADLHTRLAAARGSPLPAALSMMFLAAFGIKAAVFPLFFWLPAAYHTPPAAVSALFSGLLTKVGVYALIRVFTLVFVQDVSYTHTIILTLSGFTMVTGVLGAVAQSDSRRILSFHIVSQIGYMIMGLGLFTSLALAGSVFYLIHHIVVKTNLFLISGVAQRLTGTYSLPASGGVYRRFPALGVMFLVSALSLAGMPPFSGFFAKLILLRAALALDHFLIMGIALAVGLLTLFSMTKFWSEVFWKVQPETPQRISGRRRRPAQWLPVASLAAITIVLGLAAEPVFRLSSRAARQLLDPTEYLEAVLGGPRR